MDNPAYQAQADNDPGHAARSERARLADASDVIAYLQTINKLRDIYIDSSLFKNPVWDAFLTLYAKLLADEPMTIATLSTNTRVARDDCETVVERLRNAGLVQIEDAETDGNAQRVALTDQGRQRMDAFLRSASRSQ